MKVYFNNIESVIIDHIHKSNNAVGCIAWFTNLRILKNMMHCFDWLELIINNDDINNKDEFYEQAVTHITAKKKFASTIIKVENDNSVLMHNKFLVLRKEKKPYAVITGSYNYTNKANNNFENICISYDTKIINQYLEEYKRIRGYYLRNELYNKKGS